MPIIEREDGINFAVYTYRELVLLKRASLLRQEIALLQKENGNYARFFEQDTGDIEVVFSQDKGYLLAESVWFYFDQPSDFIFCEALPDNKNAILVVARGGSIFLDSKVPISNLVDEFISLATSDNAYEIFVYGDNIPLAEQSSDETYAFPEDTVKSFTVLDSAVLPLLEPDEGLALLPVSEAFKELSAAKSKLPQTIIAVAFLALLFFGLYTVFKPKKEVAQPISVFRPLPVDPYGKYKKMLVTPAPEKLIKAFTDSVEDTNTVPGWRATQLEYTQQTLTASLVSVGGSTHLLVEWVSFTHAIMHGEGNNAIIVMKTNVPDRIPPKQIYQIRALVANLFDALNHVLPSGSVQIGDFGTFDNYVATDMTVKFTEITPVILNLIGKQLADLPVNLGTISATMKNGLLSGSFDLQVFGYGTSDSENVGENNS